MNAIRQIASYHFRNEVFKKTYLLTLFSLPLFLLLMVGLITLVDSVENEPERVGVVDPGHFLQFIPPAGEADEAPELLLYSGPEEALSSLESDRDPLDAVYILPADYPVGREVELVYVEPLSGSTQRYFTDVLRQNLLVGEDPLLIERVLEGPDLMIRATEYNREFPASNPTAELFIPLVLAVIYIFTIIPVAGIMTGALGEEKVNRTVEVVLTSVSARDLITGKILAVSAIAVFQIAFWIFLLVIFVWMGGSVFGVEWLQGIEIPWRDAGVVAFLAVPGFVFYGAALVLIGSLLDNAESLAQAGGLVFFPLFLPIYVLPALIEQPNSTLALVFSILPFTSVQTVGLQSIFMEVPALRIAAAAIGSWLSAGAMIWLASRAFRVGMLRYGKRVRFRELLERSAGAR